MKPVPNPHIQTQHEHPKPKAHINHKIINNFCTIYYYF